MNTEVCSVKQTAAIMRTIERNHPTSNFRILDWIEQNQQRVREKKEIFTTRELEIIRLIGEGLDSYQIADQLFISKNTVDTHRKNIKRKGDFQNTRDFVIFSLFINQTNF